MERKTSINAGQSGDSGENLGDAAAPGGDRKAEIQFDKIVQEILAASTDEAVVNALKANYPHIEILGDASSYGGDGNEIFRTAKSMLCLARLGTGDGVSLGGEGHEKLEQAYSTLINLTQEGIKQLGAGAVDEAGAMKDGMNRLMAILSIHDLAKSDSVAKAAEQQLGCSDHDMALSALVQNNFQVLEGVVSDAQLESLRKVISDPVVRDFLEKPQAISGFNAGRHLQGEGTRGLFLKTVKSIDAAGMAEWIADWGAVNGHADLRGPMFLSHVPPAINGTANALATILEASAASADLGDVWQELAYPAETLQQLGLSMDTPKERAITRVAFMGREHQKDSLEGLRGVEGIRMAFDALPESMAEQLIAELNADDLDLGFTPHNVAELRKGRGLGPGHLKFDYETFLLGLHRTIEQVRKQKLEADVITTNLPNKEGLYLNCFVDTSTANAQTSAGKIAVQVTVDGAGVCKAEFSVAEALEIDLPQANLQTMEGSNFIVGGIGGGGDLYQAGAVAISLEANSKEVPAVFSVRRGDFDDVVSKLENIEVVSREAGIIRILPDTEGIIGTSNRLPEVGAARSNPDRPVYLLIDNDKGKTLDLKVEKLAEYVSESTGTTIDGVVGVDTGGDSLEPLANDETNASISTPDQDHTSVQALSRVRKLKSYTCVVAAGVDSPENFPDVLAGASATSHVPADAEREAIHAFLSDSGLGVDDRVFSRTSLVYKTMMSGDDVTGYQYIDGIPLEKRLSKKNPWMSWVNLHPSMQSMNFMKAGDHLAAISPPPRVKYIGERPQHQWGGNTLSELSSAVIGAQIALQDLAEKEDAASLWERVRVDADGDQADFDAAQNAWDTRLLNRLARELLDLKSLKAKAEQADEVDKQLEPIYQTMASKGNDEIGSFWGEPEFNKVRAIMMHHAKADPLAAAKYSSQISGVLDEVVELAPMVAKALRLKIVMQAQDSVAAMAQLANEADPEGFSVQDFPGETMSPVNRAVQPVEMLDSARKSLQRFLEVVERLEESRA